MRGWWPIIREPYAGAWQRNTTISRETILSFHAVYACVTLIASDIAKCRLRLVEQDDLGIWTEKDVPAFTPVLRKPNHYQNRIKFIEQWIVSKLLHGNAYILKERDARNIVVALYVLDPTRCRPLVSNDGSVWYYASRDNLSGVAEEGVYFPASEIIHDVMIPLFHPLVGVSPLTACGLAAAQALSIQDHSSRFFTNGARPSGILTAPGAIDDETAARLKQHFEDSFTAANTGRIAVLGDGLKYESMVMTSTDAQLIEQLKWSAENVAGAFQVPPYKIGVGQLPNYSNIEALDQQYYSQCLQKLFECVEAGLDEGLGLDQMVGLTYGTEFDLDDLLRMDSKTMAETEDKLKNIKTPNESRLRLNLPPVDGGDAVYRQQQDFSLEALAKRDAQADPFATSGGGRGSVSASPSSAGNGQAVAPESSDGQSSAEAIAAQSSAARALILRSFSGALAS